MFYIIFKYFRVRDLLLLKNEETGNSCVFSFSKSSNNFRKSFSMPGDVTLFQDTLIKSLKFGFVDNVKYQEGEYSS